MKLTLISMNGQWAFVWMPDKSSHGRYGYGSDGKCRAPFAALCAYFGIRNGEGVCL